MSEWHDGLPEEDGFYWIHFWLPEDKPDLAILRRKGAVCEILGDEVEYDEKDPDLAQFVKNWSGPIPPPKEDSP